MKKILSIFFAFAILTTSLFSSSLISFAATVETINENSSYDYTYNLDKDIFEHIYKFIPSKTDYYTFTASSKIDMIDDGAISVAILDSDECEIAWNNWSDISRKASTTAKLTANKVYYFVVECWQGADFLLSAKVEKHAHNLNKSIDPAEIIGSDYYSGDYYYECKTCDYISNGTISAVKTITLSASKYSYDGKAKTPSVTIKTKDGRTLKKDTDYTLSYSSGRKNVGKYTVKITFKGMYKGTKNLTYNINPKGTSMSKVTAAKKGFKAVWKKQATQTTGYELQYSTSSNFKKGTKTVNISKNKTTSKSVGKLSAKKKYYVRVRTYKTVKFCGKNVKLYSGWSKAKAVTTKK